MATVDINNTIVKLDKIHRDIYATARLATAQYLVWAKLDNPYVDNLVMIRCLEAIQKIHIADNMIINAMQLLSGDDLQHVEVKHES